MSNYRTRSYPKARIDDPYLREYKDPTICVLCGLVYHNKRWIRDPELKEKIMKDAHRSKCPACKKIEDGYFMGRVLLSGKFLIDHRDEIEHLVYNIEKKEKVRYPLDRIMEFVKKENSMEIRTTSEHLAITIGRAVHKSFGGSVKYLFREGEKYVEVVWERKENKKGGKK